MNWSIYSVTVILLEQRISTLLPPRTQRYSSDTLYTKQQLLPVFKCNNTLSHFTTTINLVLKNSTSLVRLRIPELKLILYPAFDSLIILLVTTSPFIYIHHKMHEEIR